MPDFYRRPANGQTGLGNLNPAKGLVKSNPVPKVNRAFVAPLTPVKEAAPNSSSTIPAYKLNLTAPPISLKKFGFLNYLFISLFWLGITYLWGGINGVILPTLNQGLINENYKGTTLGIITALGMVVAIIVQPAVGAFSDVSRHPWGRRRPFILLGGTLAICGLLLLAGVALFFHNWWYLLLAYLLLQFADNIAQGAYQGFIPDQVPEGKRSRASGAMGIAQIIGNVGGLGAATYFIDQNQPVPAIMVICIVFISTLLPTLFLVPEEPLKKEGVEKPLEAFKNVWPDLKQNPDFVLFILSRLFVLTALATISVFALYYLQDVILKGQGKLSESYTLLGVVIVSCSLASIFPAVWLSERIGRKKLVMISCSIGAVGMLLLSTATNMTEVVTYSAFLGIATGSFNSIDWALATDLIDRKAAGRLLGVSNLAGAGSQALAALLGGSLRDGFNALGVTFFGVSNLGYSALFIFGALYFVLGIIFLSKVKEPPVKSGEVLF